jgi:hypothetical protein
MLKGSPGELRMVCMRAIGVRVLSALSSAARSAVSSAA